jgi:hypothetical protein
MAEQTMNLRHKFTPEDYEDLQTVLAWWFDVLEMEPILLIGQHTYTGGLVCNPFNKDDLSGEKVIEILEEAIAYIKKSRGAA